jgi:hypothetical protein
MKVPRGAFVVAALCLAATLHSRAVGAPAGLVVRYPSGDAPSPAALQAAMSDPDVSTIVFEKGVQLFSSALFVFKRDDLTLRGATGNPRDVTIQSSAAVAFQVEQAQGTSFQGLTITSSAAGGIGVLLNAVPGPTLEGFVSDTSISRCVFDSYIGVQASVRTRNLSVADSRFVGEPFSSTNSSGGAGLLWEDGPGLFVTRSRFTTARGVSALAALFVRGAQSASSAGDRATHLLITRNRVDGDFATGFDLADVQDTVVRGNRFQFPDSVIPGARGRVGIVVRRAAATQPPQDYDVRSNFVRRAHYGTWFLGVGPGTMSRNDFRGCGSPQVDASTSVGGFGDDGGAVRINVLAGKCNTTITRNDFRRLRSPVTIAAVVLFPNGQCDEAANPGNRVDAGRALFGGSQ